MNITDKKICTGCGWIGTPADFLFNRRLSNLCKVCRLKRQAEKINKRLDIELRKQTAEQTKRRQTRDRLKSIETGKQKAGQN